MAERKTYPGGLVKAFGVPDIAFPQYAEQAKGMTNLVQKINAVNTFALGQLSEVAKEEGYKYASDNQISLNQYMNADPIERNKLVEGDKLTVAGKTVRAAQINFLASEMEIAASSAFTTLKIQAVATEWEIGEYKMALDAIVDGYSEALMDADPEAALSAKAKLASTAHSYLASYSDRTLKKSLAIKSNEALIFADQELIRLNEYIIEGSKSLSTAPGEAQTFIDLDQALKFRKEAVVNALKPHLTGGEIVRFMAAWDKEVIKAKKGILFEWLDQPNNKVSAEATKMTWNEVDAETFRGDVGMQKLFKSLSSKDQLDFKGKVKTWKENIYARIIQEDEDYEIDLHDEIEEFDALMVDYDLNNDYEAAEKLIKKIEKMAALDDKYKPLETKYKELFIKKVDSSSYLDLETWVALQEDLVHGRLEGDEIYVAWLTHKIGHKQYTELQTKYQARKKAKFRVVDTYLKNAIGYVEADIISTRDADDVAYERYRVAINELINYSIHNPGASEDDLKLKAEELLLVHTEDATQTKLINKSKKTLVRQSGYQLSNTLWTKWFKNYVNTDEGEILEHITIVLSTKEGATKILDQVDDLIEMSIEDRPLQIPNEKLDLLIEELKKLIRLYD